MKQIEINTKLMVFENPSELSDEDQILLARAKEATLKSYAPYSNFKVGAAILLDSGEIVSGANQENAAYPACLCAERVALSAMTAQFPNKKPIKIAVVARNENKPLEAPAAPCGECRQVIFEFEKRYEHPIEILLRGEVGKIYKVSSAADMLPLAFSKSDLI